jgi:hypothetical protein
MPPGAMESLPARHRAGHSRTYATQPRPTAHRCQRHCLSPSGGRRLVRSALSGSARRRGRPCPANHARRSSGGLVGGDTGPCARSSSWASRANTHCSPRAHQAGNVQAGRQLVLPVLCLSALQATEPEKHLCQSCVGSGSAQLLVQDRLGPLIPRCCALEPRAGTCRVTRSDSPWPA